jgi:hypothetical protein
LILIWHYSGYDVILKIPQLEQRVKHQPIPFLLFFFKKKLLVTNKIFIRQRDLKYTGYKTKGSPKDHNLRQIEKHEKRKIGTVLKRTHSIVRQSQK